MALDALAFYRGVTDGAEGVAHGALDIDIRKIYVYLPEIKHPEMRGGIGDCEERREAQNNQLYSK